MPNKNKLSFIIVNYRSERYLKKCLASLFKKINPRIAPTNIGAGARVKSISFEIIIVNNDKNNLTKIENAKIINLKKNTGFGKANNIGAEKATGDFLCFLNPDTILISKNVNKIIKELKSDSKIGVIGPKVLNKFNRSQEWSAGVKATPWDLIRNNLGIRKSRKIWESEIKKEAGWVSGAALFIPRELFLKIGGFDKNFFLYFEDIDLCRRVKELGKKVIYFPEVKIKHWGGKSSFSKSGQKKEYYKSQDYYFRKHYGKSIGWLIRVLRKVVYNIHAL